MKARVYCALCQHDHDPMGWFGILHALFHVVHPILPFAAHK